MASRLMNRRQLHVAAMVGTGTITAGSPFVIAAEKKPLMAGAAETVVTPAAEGTCLIGPMKPSTGVNDDLYARALVLADGDNRIAIVTLDYLGFDFGFTRVLLTAASKASGIPTDHIMLNCSHTHSAPLTAPWGPWQEHQEQPFHQMLPAGFTDSSALGPTFHRFRMINSRQHSALTKSQSQFTAAALFASMHIS